MKTALSCLAVVVAVAALSPAASAVAQDGGYPAGQRAIARRPFRASYPANSVSPYVNLLRNDLPAVVNYYTLVRPEFDQQAFNARESAGIGRLQSEVGRAQQVGDAWTPSMRSTGHTGRFMSYSQFYFREPGQR
jgi:hypothetical protein